MNEIARTTVDEEIARRDRQIADDPDRVLGGVSSSQGDWPGTAANEPASAAPLLMVHPDRSGERLDSPALVAEGNRARADAYTVRDAPAGRVVRAWSPSIVVTMA